MSGGPPNGWVFGFVARTLVRVSKTILPDERQEHKTEKPPREQALELHLAPHSLRWENMRNREME